MDQNTRMRCQGTIHVVRSGDSLYKIAQTYRVSIRDIMRANPYVNVYNLQLGDELCIPVSETPVIQGARPYIVRRQDTIASIIQSQKTSFDELARLNKSVAALTLPAGTVIAIPTKIQPRT